MALETICIGFFTQLITGWHRKSCVWDVNLDEQLRVYELDIDGFGKTMGEYAARQMD